MRLVLIVPVAQKDLSSSLPVGCLTKRSSFYAINIYIYIASQFYQIQYLSVGGGQEGIRTILVPCFIILSKNWIHILTHKIVQPILK